VTSEIISNITKYLPGKLKPDDVDALYQNIFNQMTDPDYESSRITINMGMDVMGTRWNPSTLPSQIIIDPSIFNLETWDTDNTGTSGLPGSGQGYPPPEIIPSDRRLKKNIELIGKSPSGINIYEWEYKDVNFINILSDRVYGDGKYRGVMADDIPFDAVTELDNGYLAVNYSKIDVDFEKIKRYKNDHRPT
jgi:hypothetical protein